MTKNLDTYRSDEKAIAHVPIHVKRLEKQLGPSLALCRLTRVGLCSRPSAIDLQNGQPQKATLFPTPLDVCAKRCRLSHFGHSFLVTRSFSLSTQSRHGTLVSACAKRPWCCSAAPPCVARGVLFLSLQPALGGTHRQHGDEKQKLPHERDVSRIVFASVVL